MSHSRHSFLNFVVDSLEQHHLLMSTTSNNDYKNDMQRLRFVGPITSRRRSDGPDKRIQKMVNFALDENNFIELNLVDGNIGDDFESRPFRVASSLPDTIFSAEHVKFLKLKGFYLESDENLILSGPLIEDFSLVHCTKLKEISLSGSNLKHVVLDSLYGLEKVHIDPRVSLQSFSFTDHEHKRKPTMKYISEINLYPCKTTLKFLKMKNTDIVTYQWFQDHFALFDLLETLKLDTCATPKNICIISNSLKTLELRNCYGLEDIDIKLVNLESLLCHSQEVVQFLNIRGCLYLKHMDLSGPRVAISNMLVSQFKFLETLKLNGCKILENINIVNHYLTSLELKNRFGFDSIDVIVLNLETFRFDVREERNQSNTNININNCVNLKHLEMRGVLGVTDEFFVVFPYLEKLELEGCNSMEKIELYCGCLTSLKLLDCVSLFKVEIEAPNLVVSFIFTGVSLPSSLVLISPPSLVPKLYMTSPFSQILDARFRKWSSDSMLSFNTNRNTMSLRCTFLEALIFRKEMREKLIPSL